MKTSKYYTATGPGPGKGGTQIGPKLWTNYFKFPYGAELAIRGMQMLHSSC